MGYSKSQIEFVIDEYVVGTNAERNRKILKRRLIDGISFEKIGEEFDLSTQQIKNVVYSSERELYEHLSNISF